MSRTLITGAAGFTGRYLVHALAERGYEVHGLVHSQAAETVEGAAAVHLADLADFQAVSEVIDRVRPTRVVHLAAVSYVAHDDVADLYRSNVVGTRQLLEALSRSPEGLQSILLASSANIYGNSRAGILEEALPPSPANDYGVSKVAAEYLAHIYSDRLPLVVVRPFNYTGPGQGNNFIIPKIVSHVRDRSPMIELGNLDVSRDFSDVRTVVDAYSRLLDQPRAIGGTFNICSGKAVSLRTIIDLAQEVSGHSFDVKVNPAFVRSNEVQSLWGSPARVESLIGPLNHIPLEETLRWMLES
ncbi:MAG: GDP-mannose 4,6-dehydratase [Pseudomonadota bacterium]|nr:GDP-mannose 4,6-dehydratase [Pseudomonadota bacterium]